MEKLLIVDDEIEILEWLEELFSYEFQREIEVYTASSAKEALILLDKVPLDVVLTDIRMPGMDGIVFYEKIKENWTGCRVIFLTGYRDFEELYQISRNKDVRYVLKSEDDNVIMQAVEDACYEIRRDMERRKSQKLQQDQLKQVNYWMKREFLNQILIDPKSLVNRIEEQDRLGIAFSFQDNMLPFLLRLDPRWDREMEDHILLEKYVGHIREYLPKWIRVQEIVWEKRFVLLLIQPVSKENNQWHRIFSITKGAIETVQEICEQQDGFSAVISSETVTFYDVKQAISKLKKIMVGYLGGLKSAVIHAEKTADLCVSEMKWDNQPISTGGLKVCLELHQKEAYFRLLNEICRIIGNGKSRHDMYSMELYFNVSSMLLQFINTNHLQETLAFRIGLYKLLSIDEHKDWVEAATYLISLSEEIFVILGDYENTLSKRALDRVIEYIENHLDGDLTLTNLAYVGGFNASYLSRLFKQIHNETISEYVLKKRMEKAKDLLAESVEKIQDISIKTGYTSSNSFSRAFRSYMGMSPVEYREVIQSSKSK